MAEEIERIYVIPLKKVGFKSSKAAPTAIKRVKGYLTRHMKVEEKNIWIDDSLNNAIWAYGKYKMPSKIRVKAVKFEDGVVEAYLPELEFKKSRRELLREEREKKEPILKKDDMGLDEDEDTGAEDYNVVPTGDGDVKIKKKKTGKDKEETDEKPKETKKKPADKPKKDEKEEKPVEKPKKTPTKKPETKKETSKKEKKPAPKKEEKSE